jgi:RNA polymerase sigma-70 factor (ECF subfamily)
MNPSSTIAQESPKGWFVTTHWSVVLNTGHRETGQAQDALARLCQTYWYPLYAYVRWRGHSPEDAQDLTQGFFEGLLEKNTLARVTREKGKFRSFLLAALNNFLVDEWKKANALKRGALKVISWDAVSAETRYRQEPVETATMETIYDQNWALALLEEVFQQLKHEYEQEGRSDLFEKLKFCLTGERSSIPYAELSEQLKVTEGALKVMVHRLRQRYREQLRAEVANTVSYPEEVEEELRYLFRVLSHC